MNTEGSPSAAVAYWSDLKPWQKALLVSSVGVVVVATGGAAAYAIAAGGGGIAVTTVGGSTTTLAVGRAALEVARRLNG